MGFSPFLLLSHILALTLLFPATKPDLAADRAALLSLRAAIGGSTNLWNPNLQNPCFWAGVFCGGQPRRVTGVRLPADGLSGEIPPNIFGNLTELSVLSLRKNSLSGKLPLDLGSCKKLRTLSLEENRFSGDISSSLYASLSNLVRLNLAGNGFTGKIPAELGKLTKLKTLYLERNQLSGSIPEFSHTVEQFNVSDNKLNGSVPINLQKMPKTAFLKNSLCGSPLDPCSIRGGDGGDGGGSKLSRIAIIGIVIGLVAVVGCLILVPFIVCRKVCRGTKTAVDAAPPSSKGSEFEAPIEISGATWDEASAGSGGEDEGLVFFRNGAKVFDMKELLHASAEILGRGVLGTTYKASMGVGEVAVKRLNACVPEGEFRERVEKLGSIENDNVLSMKGYFYGKEEKLLIYDFASMGSLSSLLHRKKNAKPLSWELRSSYAIGAALGIEYLHLRGVPHGSVKSSNIFPTKDSSARVSDFGIAQLLSSESGTEAHQKKGDIYSFGVVLLELLTGKVHHTYLPNWVGVAQEEDWVTKVLDPNLLKDQNFEQQMVMVLELALSCTSSLPERRPTMAYVRKRLEEIRQSDKY